MDWIISPQRFIKAGGCPFSSIKKIPAKRCRNGSMGNLAGTDLIFFFNRRQVK
ncbi:hypothetical protein [Neobacillus mesonae]|uniref:hypothetical protein n=1 Tax=Neobacillus mesonae TaxID=1193713 RepID=UPI002E2217D6|nr:hypothetical protein [Neobacillus mesonae]